ncbi:MAG: class I adenylate-forming enzyme family protein [Pseudomonadota bacterium]
MHTLESWLRRANRDAPAVIDDTEAVSYGELLQRSGALAAALNARFGRDTYLLIRAEKTLAFVATLIAVSRSGNIPVPVDPDAPDKLIVDIAERCGGATLVDPAELSAAAEDVADIDVSDADTALVLFTSGTSGTPKGVPVSWQNLEHSVATVSGYLGYAEHRSAAVVLPLHYSYALLTQLFCMLFVGGVVRLFGSFRNPIKFAKAVEQQSIATFCGVPTTYKALIAIHRLSSLSMPSMRVLCSAGAAMDRTMMAEIGEMFPNAAFFDNYGMTEATPRISYIRSDDPKFREPTCGRAIAGLEVRVMDPDTHEALPDGQQGLVAVRGPNVFAGYLNDPRSTRAAFTADGFLLSGDSGCIRDGYIYLAGRADEIFNVGGEKVAPLEIERAFAEHPAVVASAVSKIEDANRGTQAVAYVELSDEVRREELIQFLRDWLPPAKIPTFYYQVSSWPLTPNGKLQRSRLAPDGDNVVSEIA